MSSLYVVATPIGNLGDVTLRSLEVLKSVAVIYAEDTRVSGKLLHRYEIKVPMRSYREAAESRIIERAIADVLKQLEDGNDVAYVSDAGTPAVSDPGSLLVSRVVAAGFKVIPIPGASALTAILSVAGYGAMRPLFVGFLPKKKGHQTLMGKLAEGLRSELCDAVIFYESPERIIKFLDELVAWNMPLRICLGREMTKQFEEVLHGSLDEVRAELANRASIKGEICLLVTTA